MTATGTPEVLARTQKCLQERKAFLSELCSLLGQTEQAVEKSKHHNQRLDDIRRACDQIETLDTGFSGLKNIDAICDIAWSLFHPALSAENAHFRQIARTDTRCSLKLDRSFLYFLLELLHTFKDIVAWGGSICFLTLVHKQQVFIELKAESTEKLSSAQRHQLDLLGKKLAKLLTASKVTCKQFSLTSVHNEMNHLHSLRMLLGK